MPEATEVKCPFCSAEPGEPCKDPNTGETLTWNHRGREVLAKGG